MQNCCFSSVMCGKPRTDDCLSMASAVRFTRASIRVYLKANCGSIPNSGGGFVSVSGLPRPFCAVWPCGRVAVWPCGRVGGETCTDSHPRSRVPYSEGHMGKAALGRVSRYLRVSRYVHVP